MSGGMNGDTQEPRRNGRRGRVAGIENARTRWGVIQSRGRTRGVVALVVAVIVVVVIAVLAGSNASVAAIVIVLALVVVGTVIAVIGKNRTGLGLTPEWKPEAEEDDQDLDDVGARDVGDDPEPSETSDGPSDDVTVAEPVRRLDAQILGEDLAKLGQVVSPKLAKSYSVGSLVLEDAIVSWEPGTMSRAAGIETLSTAPAQVSAVETAPLWGSWALLRVATAGGDEWCMRVPGSVDLSPGFAEMGLTLRKID